MHRGLIYNLVSNIMFFLSGYALHFFLGNSMPPAEYGIVGTILTVLDFEYMFVSNGARQSLASQISSGRYDIIDVILKTTAFQLLVIAVFFCLNFFGAPLLSALLNDSSLEFYFRVAGALVIVNGLEVILLGINDGLQRFGTSALLSTFYPIAKLGTIPLIIFVFSDDPVLGVEVGFIIAVVLTILLGCVLLAHNHKALRVRRDEKVSFSQVAKHTLSFSIFFIVVSLVLSFDTLIVKALVEPASMAGYYTGAVNFGKITYYLLQAFSTVILPVVSGLVGAGKRTEALSRIRELILLAVTGILPITVIISASSADLLSAFYAPDYTVAGTALSCLAFSNFFMGMTVVLNMVLNATHPSRFSDVLSVVSLIVVLPLFVLATRWGGISAIAATSMVCTCLMMLASYAMVRHEVGGVVTRKTLAVVAVNVVLWLGTRAVFTFVGAPGLLTMLVIYVLLYAVYLLVLIASRLLDVKGLLKSLKS